MITNNPQNRREYFRLEYPIKARPYIVFNNKKKKYPVIDISAKGLRFLANEDIVELEWIPQMIVQGTLKLHCGPTLDIQAKVLYTIEDYVVIIFNKEFPLKIINDEHRYIINNFAT